MAFFTFPHRHAGAIPEGLGHFGLLVLVMAAGTESSAELILVAGQTLQDHRGHARIAAKISTGALGVGLGELANHFQAVSGL